VVEKRAVAAVPDQERGVMRPYPLGVAELEQVPRLEMFRAEHPDVIIGIDEFGNWQARIPEPNGETVTIRYRLVELLDRLGELTGPPAGEPR